MTVLCQAYCKPPPGLYLATGPAHVTMCEAEACCSHPSSATAMWLLIRFHAMGPGPRGHLVRPLHQMFLPCPRGMLRQHDSTPNPEIRTALNWASMTHRQPPLWAELQGLRPVVRVPLEAVDAAKKRRLRRQPHLHSTDTHTTSCQHGGYRSSSCPCSITGHPLHSISCAKGVGCVQHTQDIINAPPIPHGAAAPSATERMTHQQLLIQLTVDSHMHAWLWHLSFRLSGLPPTPAALLTWSVS